MSRDAVQPDNLTQEYLSGLKGNPGRAIKCTIIENLSTTVSIVLLPSELGRPVTKSMVTCDQGQQGIVEG